MHLRIGYLKKSYCNYFEEVCNCEQARISENGPVKFKVCVVQNTRLVCQGECDWWLQCTPRKAGFWCNWRALDTVLEKYFS